MSAEARAEELFDGIDEPCGCNVHPRWCAWNGPCCDYCSHGHQEAHANCCGNPPAADAPETSESATKERGDG